MPIIERPKVTFWVTRDRDPVDGLLASVYDVWTARPIRDCGTIWMPDWSESVAPMSTLYARVSKGQLLEWRVTLPDDEYQCIKVTQ